METPAAVPAGGRRRWRIVPFLCSIGLIGVGSLATELDAAELVALSETGAGTAENTAAEQQLGAGEYEAARALALLRIEEIEATGRLFDRDLVEPLRILGDASAGLDDADAAIEAYERARYVLRMNDGLDAPDQVDLLHREAAVFLKERDHRAANDRYEHAYGVTLARHGRTATLVPEQIRLADWYRANRLLPVAQALYREAIDLLEQQDPVDTYAIAEVHQRIGLTYREYVWPARGQRRGRFIAKPAGRAWGDPARRNPPPQLGIGGMFKGTRALNLARESFGASERASLDEVVDVMLDGADTMMLYRSYGRAYERYAEAYAYVEEHAPDRIDEFFGRPLALHMPHPGSLRVRDSRNWVPGRIQFSVRVNAKGAVRDIETEEVDPPGMSVFKHRRAARFARFRPAFADGKPAPAEDVKMTYRFRYFSS